MTRAAIKKTLIILVYHSASALRRILSHFYVHKLLSHFIKVHSNMDTFFIIIISFILDQRGPNHDKIWKKTAQ